MHTYIVFDIQAYNTNTLLLFLNKHFIDPIRSTLQHFCYVFFSKLYSGFHAGRLTTRTEHLVQHRSSVGIVTQRSTVYVFSVGYTSV